MIEDTEPEPALQPADGTNTIQNNRSRAPLVSPPIVSASSTPILRCFR
jgi:hypothetical protein